MESINKSILPTERENILNVRDLAVSFDVYGSRSYVLDGISFSVEKGQRVGLVGESGCGKTTTLKAILRVLAKNGSIDGGDVEFEGMSIYDMRPDDLAHMRQTGVGMIFQDPSSALNPVFTIESQFLTALKYAYKKTKSKAELRQIAIESLENVMLPDPERIMGSDPFQLSGGMRQRAAFLRTSLCKADILLLDEPFGALDVITRNDMQDWLLELRKKYNRTTLLVTHDIDEALYLSDRILILSNKPSHILQEIDLSKEKKSRDWLFSQSDLKKQVYELLKGENHA